MKTHVSKAKQVMVEVTSSLISEVSWGRYIHVRILHKPAPLPLICRKNSLSQLQVDEFLYLSTPESYMVRMNLNCITPLLHYYA